MTRFLATLLASAFVSASIVGGYHVQTLYTPGEQTVDAIKCLEAITERAGGKLTFEMTGISGERLGSYKEIWILGSEETLGNSVRSIQCAFDGRAIEVVHPTLGRFEVDL